ncbi:hypothetical protein ACIBPB_02435 [Micromonospora sp. NPDC049836]
MNTDTLRQLMRLPGQPAYVDVIDDPLTPHDTHRRLDRFTGRPI